MSMSILVTFKKLSDRDNLVDLHTLTREGMKNHFVMRSEVLHKALFPVKNDENGDPVWDVQYAADLYDFMRVYFDAPMNVVDFRVTWLHGYDDNVSGNIQNFSIPVGKLYDFVSSAKEGEGFSYLYREEERNPRINFTEAANQKINELSKAEQRALSKFIRDAFQWPRSAEIVVYPDYDGFFFREYLRGYDNNRCGICGGIIQHKSKRRGKDNIERVCIEYQSHT